MLPDFSCQFHFLVKNQGAKCAAGDGQSQGCVSQGRSSACLGCLWIEQHACVTSIMHGTSRGETLLTAGLGRDSPDVNCQHTQ